MAITGAARFDTVAELPIAALRAAVALHAAIPDLAAEERRLARVRRTSLTIPGRCANLDTIAELEIGATPVRQTLDALIIALAASLRARSHARLALLAHAVLRTVAEQRVGAVLVDGTIPCDVGPQAIGEVAVRGNPFKAGIR
jgi:hypothetical protein